MSITTTTVKTVKADGIELFYREAGSPTAPVFLLLHGFPSSSFQYRNLITKLAVKYRVIAPDLPGFGFTVVPDSRNYKYTFENIAKTIEAFTDVLELKKYAIYIFDYGAPTGLRLALSRPSAITAIISQNGNAFEEGIGAFWDPIKAYWADPTSVEKRKALEWLFTYDTTKFQYTNGEAHPEAISPETYTLDATLLSRPGNIDIQLDLFLDYADNVRLYPDFQAYFKERQPAVLAVWGSNDVIFIEPGALAFARSGEKGGKGRSGLKDVEVHLVDGGHFVLEEHLEEVAGKIFEFMEKRGL